MDIQYPESVVNKILQITLDSKSFVYLAIDDEGRLLSKGGNIAGMGLPEWHTGDNILDDALFLTGFIPMSSAYELISSYQVSHESILDVHLFQDNGCCWIILVDKTADLEWEATARQKGNELRLLKEELARQETSDNKNQQADTQFDFFEALNMMALRMNPDGSFELLKPVSNKFYAIYSDQLASGEPIYPHQEFAFLENFLVDAEQVWSDIHNIERRRSGPWIEKGPDGEEIALEASALNWKEEKLLFIEILDESYQINHDLLQIGREGELLKHLLQQEVHNQTREIRAREEEIALRLVCAADTRDDGETGSHIRRLGLYSELLARNLGWGEAACEEIRIAAPMHDIGKIGIPDQILKKPGKLTESEFDIMKLHPEIGGRILSNSKSALVQMARDISLSHHEKWDGSGYPKGLAGTNIPLSGRIVAIVDVFDALIHKRVYKDKISIDDSIELMKEGRGKHFDPELLDLFIELRDEMSKIAFDYINPINGVADDESPIADIHSMRPSKA